MSTLDEIQGKVLTVNGLIDPGELGVTMMHEHVLISVNDEHFLADPVTETIHCAAYVQAGGKTLVSMSNRGLRWDRPGAPPSPVRSFGGALSQIAAASGVNIVLGTGFYKQDWQRPEILSLSIPELEKIIVDDILEGFDGVQAGIIGEVGLSDPGASITLPIFEWKSLVASCRAMFRTGASILIHTDIGMSAAVRHLALDICDRLGAPLSRIIVSHLRPQLPEELQQARDFMKRGAMVCFDLIGHSGHSSQEDGAAAVGVARLISEGFLGQILVAEDIFDTQNFFGMLPPVGYEYLTNTFEGMLRNAGVGDAEIAAMRVANARALTFSVPDSAAELLDLASLSDIAEVPDVTVGNGRNGRRSVHLDGGSLRAAIPETAQPIVPFTAALFVRGSGITEDVCLVDSGLTEAQAGATTWPDSAARGWALRVGAGGPEFCLGTGDGAVLRAAGAADVFDDQWHHIAGVFDGVTAGIFVDGAPTGRSAELVAIPVKAGRGLAIGCSAAGAEHFTGSLTEVTFLAEALDEAKIRAMSEDKPHEEAPPDGGEEPPPDGGEEPPPDGGEKPPPDGGEEPPPDSPPQAMASPAVVSGQVITVLGTIAAADLGKTLPHEHLLLWHSNPINLLPDIATQSQRAQKFREAGGKTIVSLSNLGLRWDAPQAPPKPFAAAYPAALREISETSGVQIVMGSAYYKEDWQPTSTFDMSVEEMEAIIVEAIQTGFDGVRAGVIGEIGISATLDGSIVPREMKNLMASCNAQRKTGVAMNIHTDIGTTWAQRDLVLKWCGWLLVPMDRVIMSHINIGETGQAEAIIGRGAYAEWDLFGHSGPVADEAMANDIVALIEKGLIERMLISHDIFGEQFFIDGVGYDYILKRIVPMLKLKGLSENQINTMMISNPARVLRVQ